MTLHVDFNEEDDQGGILALLDPNAHAVRAGEFVMAEDGEGNRCKARVDEGFHRAAFSVSKASRRKLGIFVGEILLLAAHQLIT